MALVLKDRVQETATANTTVSFTMLGAVIGYQSFSSVGNTNTTYYAGTDGSGNWEVGLGTYSTTGPTLTRTTVISSSNSGSAVTFSGTVTVFLTYPSEYSALSGTSGGTTSYYIPYGNGTNQFQSSSSLQFSGTALTAPFYISNGTITGSLSAGAYSYGTLSYSDTNLLSSYSTSVNSYAQIVLQNINSGTAASTDFVVSNNNGTSSSNYGDFGINSSGFSGTGSLGAAGYVYLYSQSVDLAIGTGANNAIHFVVNSGATDAAQINTSGTLLATYAPNIGTTTSGSTITPTITTSQYNVTALAATANFAAPSAGIDGQKLMIRIKDNGTAQTLTWTTTSGGYRAEGIVLPTTTVASTPLYVGCIYNAQDSYWDVVAVS